MFALISWMAYSDTSPMTDILSIKASTTARCTFKCVMLEMYGLEYVSFVSYCDGNDCDSQQGLSLSNNRFVRIIGANTSNISTKV